jgi:hypothetical protein
MRFILFGTVIRTRKSLKKILIKAQKEGRQNHHLFKQFETIYNTGIFGIVIYRTRQKWEHFNDKTTSEP